MKPDREAANTQKQRPRAEVAADPEVEERESR
jgi:hypothetical protein